jgi:hypothetical protein
MKRKALRFGMAGPLKYPLSIAPASGNSRINESEQV